ncbi:F-box/LRR-repeat protein 14 [Umbelopsis nana]
MIPPTISLPPEILHSVFDNLFSDDLDYFTDIIACSLVSQTWNDVATYLLSRSLKAVKLHGGRVEDLFRLSHLLETISSSQIRSPYSPDDIKTINLDMSYLFNEDGSYNEDAQAVLIHLVEVLCTQTTGLELSFNHPIALRNWQEDRLKDFYQSLQTTTQLTKSVDRLALQGFPKKDTTFVVCNYSLSHLFPTFSPNLRSLEFASFPLRYAVYLLLQSCHELENVSFRDFRNIWEDGLVDAITHWSKLRTFQMTGCVHITPVILRALASHCPSLEVLIAPRNVRYSKTCPDINLPMVAIIRSCNNLSRLDLSDYVSVNDRLLQTIIEEAPKLKSLKLQNCKQITGSRHQSWWTEGSLQYLEVLDISGCSNLTDGFITEVLTRCKRLKKVITTNRTPAAAPTTHADRCVLATDVNPAIVAGVC